MDGGGGVGFGWSGGGWGGGKAEDIAWAEALRIDGGVGFGEGFDGSGLAFRNLIKGLPFLDGVGGGGEVVAAQESAEDAEETSAKNFPHTHPSALAQREAYADPIRLPREAG